MNNTIIDAIISVCGDAQLQDDQDIMSYPFYSLSKVKSTKIKTFHGKDAEGVPFTIEVTPNPTFGIQTIYDYDIVLYCSSHIAQAFQNGLIPSRTVRASRNHLLGSIGRSNGGHDYEDLDKALKRLHGTSIHFTKLQNKKGGDNGFKLFHLLEEVNYVSETKEYEITICNLLYDNILEKQLLSLSSDYFQITSGLERKLYMIFRKHAGKQPCGYWIHLDLLYRKTGTEGTFKKFKFNIIDFITNKNTLPEYYLTLEKNLDGIDGVSAIRRDYLPIDHEHRVPLMRKRTKMLANAKASKDKKLST